MLGSTALSPFGRGTRQAFGHLGLITVLGWADPQRGLSGGLMTTGKPALHLQMHRFPR
jgi:CubicO group peptidase (beta-lactamase class C family)